MTQDMTQDGAAVQRAGRTPLVLQVAGTGLLLVGALLLGEELLDGLWGRGDAWTMGPDLAEVTGAVLAIALGGVMVAGGALHRSGADRRLGRGFAATAAAVSVAGAALAAWLGMLLDAGGAGAGVLGGAVLLASAAGAALLAAAVDRRPRLALGVLAGGGVAVVGGLAALAAMAVSGVEPPSWFGLLDD